MREGEWERTRERTRENGREGMTGGKDKSIYGTTTLILFIS